MIEHVIEKWHAYLRGRLPGGLDVRKQRAGAFEHAANQQRARHHGGLQGSLREDRDVNWPCAGEDCEYKP